jgi:hypothetical protein
MRIPFLWDLTQGQCGVVLYILPHEFETSTVIRNIGIGFLRDQVSYIGVILT